ncbi:MAG TPA: GNAT family N-acetyltransferase [Solirubrobacteraceae bacterium]|nr:GNAT family N-acetyltransferase [Solirubrobacteraceae bacterium]
MSAPIPRSLIRATDFEVLPVSRVLRRGDGYTVAASPSNPLHYWGNLLLFDRAPEPGDGARWEALSEAEFARQGRVTHRTFAWEGNDGALGSAREEFLARGYELEQTVGLTARAGELEAHPRASTAVEVQALDHRPGADEDLWAQVIDIQLASRENLVDVEGQRDYQRTRERDLRELFAAGRGGAWFVARDGAEVVGSCGIVVTGGRGRYQAVDTVAGRRGEGICSRLLVDAARIASERDGARSFVIGADPGYHALAIYESLGFTPVERVAGVYRPPPEDRA